MRLYASDLLKDGLERVAAFQDNLLLAADRLCPVERDAYAHKSINYHRQLMEVLKLVNNDMNFDLAPDFDREKFYAVYHSPTRNVRLKKTYDEILRRLLCLRDKIVCNLEVRDLRRTGQQYHSECVKAMYSEIVVKEY